MPTKGQERRRHKRFELDCPLVIRDAAGKELLRTRTLNVSDGGMLVEVPDQDRLKLGAALQAAMRVPRQTENTFMYEDFYSPASVVRVDAATSASPALALKFARALALDLEV